MTETAAVLMWLLSFKGPRGALARLDALRREIEMMDLNPARLPAGMVGGKGSGISDPTARDAAALMARKERVEERILQHEEQIAIARSALALCPHGAVIGDYYLDASGDVTWMLLARDAGVTERTVQRWRDEAVGRLAMMPGIPPM